MPTRPRGPGRKVFSPKLVKGMEDFNVLEVVSGLHHTMIIAETMSRDMADMTREYSPSASDPFGQVWMDFPLKRMTE